MRGTRRLFEPGVYLNLGVILEIYGITELQNPLAVYIAKGKKGDIGYIDLI